jgi:hypothetical protein
MTWVDDVLEIETLEYSYHLAMRKIAPTGEIEM